MRTLAAVLVLLISSTALAEVKRVRLARPDALAGRGWNKVVQNLKTLSRDRNLRAALRANRGSIVLGEAVVPDKKYQGVGTLKQLVLNKHGLVIRSRIGNHAALGNGEAAFSPLPKAHYKGSTAVRFSRFGLPFYTQRLKPSEWGHLKADAVRAAGFDYKMTSAVQEAKRIVEQRSTR